MSLSVILYLCITGIMAILFNGIVMSHYTHFNLSTVTQITMQQTMRTLAFIAETCVFAYLGLALFSFRHRVSSLCILMSHNQRFHFFLLLLRSFHIIKFLFFLTVRTSFGCLVVNFVSNRKGRQHLPTRLTR